MTDSHRPSSPTAGTSFKSSSVDTNEVKPFQFCQQKSTVAEFSSHAISGGIYHMQFHSENPNLVDASSGASIPFWTFYGGMPLPITPHHRQESVKIILDSNLGEVHDKPFQKEGSWTGSNSKSVDETDHSDKNSDMDTQSEAEKESNPVFELKQSENSAFSVIKGSSNKFRKGFIPYKRQHSDASSITVDEREQQRIRLS